MSGDPSAVTPGDSTYSLRTPDSVPAAEVPMMPMERVLPRQTSTGTARGVQQLGSPNVYVDSGNEQIVVAKSDSANSSIPRVLMGNQVNKGEGFYVTKPGIDATTAKNDDDFIFNSNQNVFKIVRIYSISTPAYSTAVCTAGQVLNDIFAFSFRHDLGFTPAYVAYVQGKDTNGDPVDWLLPWGGHGVFNDSIKWLDFTIRMATTEQYFILQLETFISAIGAIADGSVNVLSYTYHIYLLQETAS